MLTRRRFAGCALCAAVTLAGGKAQAQPAQTGGLTRTELRRLDYAGTHVVVQMMVDIPAGVEFARHTHPGIESSLILEGDLVLNIEGQPERVYRKGETLQVPTGAVHWGRAGTSGDCKVFAHFVVEKDKPLASPA